MIGQDVTSWRPLAALETAKPLTCILFAQLWFRETKTVWVVQRQSEGAKEERSDTGGGERQFVLWCVCVCASDIVIERRRKVVVHMGRGTELERRQGRNRRSDGIRTILSARDLSLNSGKALFIHD